MATLTHLRWVEHPRLDPRRVENLHNQLGANAADDIVFSVIEELSQRISRCRTLMENGDWDDLCETAQSMPPLADQVGMVDVVRVASDVAACAKAQNTTAAAAALARLKRVNAMSMDAIWDLQGMSV